MTAKLLASCYASKATDISALKVHAADRSSLPLKTSMQGRCANTCTKVASSLRTLEPRVCPWEECAKCLVHLFRLNPAIRLPQ